MACRHVTRAFRCQAPLVARPPAVQCIRCSHHQIERALPFEYQRIPDRTKLEIGTSCFGHPWTDRLNRVGAMIRPEDEAIFPLLSLIFKLLGFFKKKGRVLSVLVT